MTGLTAISTSSIRPSIKHASRSGIQVDIKVGAATESNLGIKLEAGEPIDRMEKA